MAIKLFSGNSNRPLAEKIARFVGLPLCQAKLNRFSDGEVQVEIGESVRGTDVFIIQSGSFPVNETLMELLIMIDAMKRASASRITAVMPYYCYSRQDRKVIPRTPISAKLVSDLLTTSGCDRVLSMDLHAGQIQGFFNIPFDNLYALPVMADFLHSRYHGEEVVVISPDAGGTERAREFAKRLNCDLAVIDKRRDGPNKTADMRLIGEVKGKTGIIIDDMIDTAGTLVMAADTVKENGASKVLACATHGLFSGPAASRINESSLEEVIVTDTIPTSELTKNCEKIRHLTVSNLLGEAVKRIHYNDSVSSLFY